MHRRARRAGYVPWANAKVSIDDTIVQYSRTVSSGLIALIFNLKHALERE
jgi:hypothetical protein